MGRPFKPRSECLMCGEKVHRFGKKFCSRQCASRHHVIPILERREHRECPVCHGMFSEKPALMDRGRKYCSKACADKALIKKHTFVCSKCKQQKSEEDFYVDRLHARGHVSRCKTCYAETARKVTALKPYHREESFRSGAKRRNLPYELTREQFMRFWQKPCVYCGDEIQTVGLDRADNSKGYTMDNILPCCSTCNAMKSKMSIDEFLDRCRRISKRADCNSALTFRGRY